MYYSAIQAPWAYLCTILEAIELNPRKPISTLALRGYDPVLGVLMVVDKTIL